MPSKWIEHCQKYAKDNGCTYREALTLAGPSYKTPVARVPEPEPEPVMEQKAKRVRKSRAKKSEPQDIEL